MMPLREANTGGIILAGGASRRMGTDKALLCHNGKTLLELAVDVLLPVTDRVVIVAETVDRYRLNGVKTLADRYPGAGPVGGIVTGLLALGVGCHFVLACDMPFVCRDVLELLRTKAQDAEMCEAIVPVVSGELEPLCALYRNTAAIKLESFMDSGRRSARQALSILNIRQIGEAELRQVDPTLRTFRNINTPEDMALLE